MEQKTAVLCEPFCWCASYVSGWWGAPLCVEPAHISLYAVADLGENLWGSEATK
jgi:hypothetical protein